jgi:hypothetical protein
MGKKSAKIPMSSKARRALKRILESDFHTIREFAMALIKLGRHTDSDGREIGFDYGFIHDAVLQKFPTVKISGPHKGRPTRMPIKELHELAHELNTNGVKLPLRPRRKMSKPKKK